MTNSRGVGFIAIGLALVLAAAMPARAQWRAGAAQTQGVTVQLVSPDAVPALANFYVASLLATNSFGPPQPTDPFPGLPVYWIGGNNYVVDDSSVDHAAAQSAGTATMLRGGMLTADSGGSGGVMAMDFGFGSLWLEITNVSNGLAYLNLHNATNQVYGILSKTDLLLTNWTVEADVWPTNTDTMPFMVAQSGRTNLFVWAMDWTGITNAGGLYEWYSWEQFGDTNQPASGDYDGDSVDNGTEYTNGTDPNKIQFHLGFTNLYVNANTGFGTIQVLKGVPSQMAVLVNSTNWGDAVWQPYNSTVPIPLGTTDGLNRLWVGLRGRLPTSQQSWYDGQMTRDTVAPTVVITNLPSSPTSQPVIQLKGYSPEALRCIKYDVVNSTGSLTNQSGWVTDQFIDPVTMQFTTNWFECTDVPLALGTNTIVMRVTDLAGNVTVTNINLTLDYSGDTTPPVLTLLYPQDGDEVCGSSFTLRGQLDDPTATVTAQIVDSNDNTNSLNGIVERNGLMWVENLPLAAGANTVTLTMTDSAGNSATNSLSVIGDPMNLTIDDQPWDQLIGPTASVSGTIDSADYTVWVNGLEVTNYEDNGLGGWSWWADDVPITPGGTAVVHATAVPNSGGGGGPHYVPPASAAKNTEAEKELQAYWYTATFTNNSTWDGYDAGLPGNVLQQHRRNTDTNVWVWVNYLVDTHAANSGDDYANRYWTNYDYSGVPTTNGCQLDHFVWAKECPSFGNLPHFTGTEYSSTCDGRPSTHGPGGTPQVTWKIWNESMDFNTTSSDQHTVTTWHRDLTNRVVVKLRTGGKGSSKRNNLFYIAAGATESTTSSDDQTWQHATVPAGSIQVLGQSLEPTTIDGTGYLFTVLADNSEHDITPQAWVPRYEFSLNAVKCLFVNQCQADIPTNRDRFELGVGEQVDVSLANMASTAGSAAVWTTTAGSLSVTNGYATQLTAPSNHADAVTVKVAVAGQEVSRDFSVIEPTGYDHAVITSTTGVAIDTNVAGAWMHLNVFIGPTNVSFYRVQIWEVGQPASDTNGYFTNSAHPAWPHDSLTFANQWYSVTNDNSVLNGFDNAAAFGSSILPYPWSQGSFTWVIPVHWKIDSGPTNSITGWSQHFDLEANGTMTISKFGTNVIRATNNYIIPLR